MKYEGYKIGPVIRDIRKDKGLLIEEVAAKTGYGLTLNAGKGFANPTMRNSTVSDLVSMMEVISSSMV